MSKNKEFIIQKLLDKAKEHVSRMSPEEYAKMVEAQKASFVRGMTAKCEHGVLDFEQCVQCREKVRRGKKSG